MYAMRCINPHLEVFPLPATSTSGGRKRPNLHQETGFFLGKPWENQGKQQENQGKICPKPSENTGKPHICSSKVGKPMVSTVCFWLKANSMISGDRPIMTHLFLVLCNVEPFLIEKEHGWLPNSIGIWILNACFAGSTSTKPTCELFPDPISW